MNVRFCGTNPPIVHDIQAIAYNWKTIGHIKTNDIACHHWLRYYVGSFQSWKEKGLLLAQTDSLVVLEVFENHGNSKEDVTRAGEEFLLKFYGARRPTVQTLDKHRYSCYNRSIRRSSLSSSFKLESLPPTIKCSSKTTLLANISLCS